MKPSAKSMQIYKKKTNSLECGYTFIGCFNCIILREPLKIHEPINFKQNLIFETRAVTMYKLMFYYDKQNEREK